MFNRDTIKVLNVIRHPRKLRLGTLKGNRFKLRLRGITDYADLEKRIALVRDSGVPNYFGEQRFGNDFGNLEKGLALLKGELQERQKHKKGLYISAVRSWLFNLLLSMRIEQGLWDTLMQGDALMIRGSQSCFVELEVTDELLARLESQSIDLTGPLWGKGDMLAKVTAEQWERGQLQTWNEITSLLEKLSLRQERRSLRLTPQGMLMEKINDTECWLEFELPAGAFATSVLREICVASAPE